MLTRKKVQTSILLVIGILLLVNFMADRFYFRLDYTADQSYSLSNATKNILRNLNEPVTITAYFSEDLPPDIAKVKQDFRDLLIEYSSYSDGMIVYEFINPSESEESEMQAQQKGIQPIMINVRERDQMKQQRAYLGALIQISDRKEIIPFMQPGAAMEFALSTAIKKISIVAKPKLAFLQGNGEPGLNALPQLNQQLSVLYNVETIQFTDTTGVPPENKTLVIVAPKDTVPDLHLKYLDEFLSRGGRLLIALNTVEGNLSNGTGSKIYTGFSEWLKTKGIEVEENFIIDANCANVMVRQSAMGGFMMNTPVRFPYIPVVTNFTEHPITEGLESVTFPFISSIKISRQDTSVLIYPIAMTSERSGVQNPPLTFDVMKQWKISDFSLSSIPVAVVVEKVNNNPDAKLIVFGDGDFAVNGEGQEAQQLQPDNINLMINAIDWLADDTGLIELRTKSVTARPIDPALEDGTKTLLKYLNFLAPILLIIAYGVIRFQIKRRVRNKLMSVEYVQASK